MLIGEVANYLGTSPRSLRHYEQQGLLSPIRDANGYRTYDQSNIVRAGNVKALLDLGLTITDVHEYLAAGCLEQPLASGTSCSEELSTVQKRLQTLDELLSRLHGVRDRLAEYANHLESNTLHR